MFVFVKHSCEQKGSLNNHVYCAFVFPDKYGGEGRGKGINLYSVGCVWMIWQLLSYCNFQFVLLSVCMYIRYLLQDSWTNWPENFRGCSLDHWPENVVRARV